MSNYITPLLLDLIHRSNKKRRIAFLLCFIFAFNSHTAASQDSDQSYAVASKIAIHSQLLDGAQKNNLMIVVGERGHILYSKDEGQSWQQGNVPSRALLTGVFLQNEKLAWAVGHDATILRSNDGGKNWQRVYYDPEQEAPLLDIWFKDAEMGYAIGAYGLFLETQDGGKTWEQRWISDEDDFHLNHIIQLNEQQLFIAAEAGVIYRSNDIGQTWQSLDSPYHGSYFGAAAFATDTLMLFGLRGHLFLSTNLGDTWTQVDTNTTAMLTTAIKTQRNQCLIAGLNGVVLINKNCDGQHFTKHQLPSRDAISAMLETREGNILLIGESGITTFKP